MSHTSSCTPRTWLQFCAPQQRFAVGDRLVGGRPGERPTVLVGSIFYHGHDVVTDAEAGQFDREEATRRIRRQEEWSERTGNPGMLDVVGSTGEAICRHLAFAAEATTMPLLLDGTTAEVRLAGLRFVAETGLGERIVYNSIQPGTRDEELRAIAEAGVATGLILTYCLQDFTTAGRVAAVQDLLPRVQQAGIRQVIVDTCVMDLATLGQAYAAIHAVKSQFGVPAGGGVHNAVAMWRGLKTKMGPAAAKPCAAACAAAAVAAGADFLLYGPVEDAPVIFPAVAMIDTALSQLAVERGTRPEPGHPRFLIG